MFGLLKKLLNNPYSSPRMINEGAGDDNTNDIINLDAAPDNDGQQPETPPADTDSSNVDLSGLSGESVNITAEALKLLLSKVVNDKLDVDSVAEQLIKLADSFATIDVTEIEELSAPAAPSDNDNVNIDDIIIEPSDADASVEVKPEDGNVDIKVTESDTDESVVMVTDEVTGKCVVFRDNEAYEANKAEQFADVDDEDLVSDTILLSDLIDSSRELEDEGEPQPWDYTIIEADGEVTNVNDSTPTTDDGVLNDDANSDVNLTDFNLDDEPATHGNNNDLLSEYGFESNSNPDNEPDGDESISVLQSKYKEALIEHGGEDEDAAEAMSKDITDLVELVNAIRELKGLSPLSDEEIHKNHEEYGPDVEKYNEGAGGDTVVMEAKADKTKSTKGATTAKVARSTGADDDIIKKAIEDGSPDKIKKAMKSKVNHFFGLTDGPKPERIAKALGYEHKAEGDIKKKHLHDHITSLKDADVVQKAKVLNRIKVSAKQAVKETTKKVIKESVSYTTNYNLD